VPARIVGSGSGLGLYHSCATYHVYYAHNHIRQAYGGDGECVTTDGTDSLSRQNCERAG